MKKVVYIVVETKVREFYAKTLLAVELYSRGFDVVIGRMPKVRELAQVTTPGVFIDKDFCKGRQKAWKAIRANGTKVYAYDEEGIVLNEKIYKETRLGGAYELDGMFLWGNNQEKLVGEYDNQLLDKTYIVSHPRMDLLGDNVKYFYSKLGNELKQKYGPYVIVNLNFPPVNHLEHVLSGIGRSVDVIPEEVIESYKSRYEQYEKYRVYLINAIKKLSDCIPINIVIRPHPADSIELYKKALKRKKNVIVTKKYDANAWMYGAVCVIHTGCSTALEAYLINKRSVLYYPFDDYGEMMNRFPNQVSDIARTDEELLSLIQECMSVEWKNSIIKTEDRDRIVREKVFENPDKLSVQMIADIIEDNNFESGNIDFNYKLSLKEKLINLKMATGSMYRSMLGKKNALPTISIKEMRWAIGCSQSILKTDMKVNVKQCERNIFYLYHKL